MNNEGKFVFRPQNGKLPHSSNNVVGCNTCLKEKESGAALLVCSACKFVGYCNRDCQLKDWKAHKAFCKDKQQHRAMMSPGSERALSMNYMMPKLCAVEDFAHIHTFAFQSQLTYAVSITQPFDLRKKHYKVHLEERSGGDGNPARAFVVKSITLCDNFTPGPFSQYMAVACTVQSSYDRWEAFERHKVGYAGILVVVYAINGDMPWVFPFSVVPLRFPPPPNPQDWFSKIKTWTDNGLVFRVKDAKHPRKPGMLIKNKSNWVWKEKSLDELKNDGIELSPEEFCLVPAFPPSFKFFEDALRT